MCLAAAVGCVVASPHEQQVLLAPAAVVQRQQHHVQESTVARTQYHAQNQASGEYVYGYVEPNGAKEERKLPDGTVLGSYT